MKNSISDSSSNYEFTFAHQKEGFDEHINKSIRGYSDLIEDIISYSRYFVENKTSVVDIGCSTGKLIESLINENKDHCTEAQYVGIELAQDFYDDLDQKNKDLCGIYPWLNLDFLKDDICNYTFSNCSFVTSIFTLQFISRRLRKEVLQKIYNGLNHGGAFIFAEKTIFNSARLQEMITFNFYDYKKKNFSSEEILEKEKILRHMLKPSTLNEITDDLKHVGWDPDNIQEFWRNHMFVGIIAIK